MKQLSVFVDNQEKICAFTGHRILEEDFSEKALKSVVRSLVKQGVYTFFCGMAIGFDLLAAESVLSLKKREKRVRLIACIPCEGQDKYYSKEDKLRYQKALALADEKILLSENYFQGCMQVRDTYMAERANILVAYCKRKTGGTAYTVGRFQKLHPDGEIFFL